MFDNIVIGAGPAGLSVANFLKNRSNLILEKSGDVGGTASTFERGGFFFDYGPHIMFSKNKPVLEFMKRSLGDNIHECKRNNKISFNGSLIKYPFENDLSSLPKEDNFECIRDFVINPHKEKYPNPNNLEEWLLSVFGESICAKYLFPYNEKVWNIPVRNLSMLWAERIPNPPVEDVIKSAVGFSTEGYLHQLYYHYPLRGGYQMLSRALADSLDVQLNEEVLEIHKAEKHFEVKTTKGHYQASSVVSTMPVHMLPSMCQFEIPQNVRSAIDALIVNPMAVISLGVKGEDQDQFTAIYFPERDFKVNRVSFPTTFSPYNSPPGHYSIQAEVTFSKTDPFAAKSDSEIIDHVVDGLTSRGIVDKKNIVLTDLRRVEFAYVVYDTGYEKNAKLVRDYFNSIGIHLNGRFGNFEYLNVDGIYDLSKRVAETITGDTVDLDSYFTN